MIGIRRGVAKKVKAKISSPTRKNKKRTRLVRIAKKLEHDTKGFFMRRGKKKIYLNSSHLDQIKELRSIIGGGAKAGRDITINLGGIGKTRRIGTRKPREKKEEKKEELNETEKGKDIASFTSSPKLGRFESLYQNQPFRFRVYSNTPGITSLPISITKKTEGGELALINEIRGLKGNDGSEALKNLMKTFKEGIGFGVNAKKYLKEGIKREKERKLAEDEAHITEIDDETKEEEGKEEYKGKEEEEEKEEKTINPLSPQKRKKKKEKKKIIKEKKENKNGKKERRRSGTTKNNGICPF